MANNTVANPKFFDNTTGATLTGPFALRLIQWVDDNADIPDDGTLVLTINGVALTVKVQRAATVADGLVVLWQIGPFNPGIPINSLVVTTMATGNLHVWVT